MRQIPIINDVLKWWGPSDANITGRTFNLQSGKIASTEVTYKYHIQVEEASKEKVKKESNSESHIDYSDKISINSHSNLDIKQ